MRCWSSSLHESESLQSLSMCIHLFWRSLALLTRRHFLRLCCLIALEAHFPLSSTRPFLSSFPQTTMSTPSQPPTSRGLFIVLEGLDRSGKSTQCELLIQRLQAQGRAVKGWKFPGELDLLPSLFSFPPPPVLVPSRVFSDSVNLELIHICGLRRQDDSYRDLDRPVSQEGG